MVSTARLWLMNSRRLLASNVSRPLCSRRSRVVNVLENWRSSFSFLRCSRRFLEKYVNGFLTYSHG